MSRASGEWDHLRRVQLETGWGRVLERFAAWCRPQPGWTVLDIGCGPGLLPALFAQSGCRAAGVDREPGIFRPQPVHPEVVCADARSLPFPAGRFNLVTAVNLLFLLGDPVEALREMRRLLAPGGRIALLNPSEHMSLPEARRLADRRGLQGTARESLLSWAENAETHAGWDATDLEGLFVAAGLRLERSELWIGPGLARLASGVPVE